MAGVVVKAKLKSPYGFMTVEYWPPGENVKQKIKNGAAMEVHGEERSVSHVSFESIPGHTFRVPSHWIVFDEVAP